MGETMAKLNTGTGYLGTDETPRATNSNQTARQTLSDPEAHVLLLIAAGKQPHEIGASVGADQTVVKEHIKSILRKAKGAGSQTSRPRETAPRSSEFPAEMLSPFIA